VAGFAAIQQSDLPTRLATGGAGNLDFPVTLGPFGALGEAIAYYLDHTPATGPPSPEGLRQGLAGLGLQVGDVVVADLNGDGASEVGAVIPFGPREQTLWLFVARGGRWQAIATLPAPRGLDGVQALGGGKQALRVRNVAGASAPATLLGWDGARVGLPTAAGALAPVPTDFAPSTGCAVAEPMKP
jgi:hypothetical protein